MDLYSEFKTDNNSQCNGCSVLLLPGEHCIDDWGNNEQVDILFVSDSLKLSQGSYVPFRYAEYKAIQNELRGLSLDNISVGYTAATKCPNTPNDFSSANQKICRKYIQETILKARPKLVFACGKLATTMLYGKKIQDKKSRGKAIEIELGDFKYKMVSIFHPYQVVAEPKNAFLFSHDIKEAILEYILDRPKIDKFEFNAILSIEELKKFESIYIDTKNPIACDTESTGLNFLTDTLHSIAFTRISDSGDPEHTIALPIDHKDFNSPGFKEYALDFTRKVLANKSNRKIFQNATHDLKFLIRYGITEVNNVWDTKLMQSLYNEDNPKSLSDLVYYYFNDEDRS